jgi:uncharacterized membrane protein YraQ (UPF0718 family)
MQLQSNWKIRYLLLVIILAFIVFKIFNVESFLTYDPNGIQVGYKINDLVTTFRSILIQSFPFLVIGSLVSAIVAAFVKEEWLLKIIPKNRFVSHFMVSLIGFLMPVCECGNVPVARRFMLQGFKVSHAVTFLMSAPILNPITLWSTYEAFRGVYQNDIMLWSRIISCLVIANALGLIISYKKNQYSLLTESFYKEVCEHVPEEKKDRARNFVNIFAKEFSIVATTLIVGAFIATLFQLIPREFILGVGQNVILSILAMMLYAFIISVCSNVDSFLVIRYTSTFTPGSIASYLTFGPLIDIKVLTMLRSSFTTKTLIFFTVFILLSSMITGLIVNLL